MSEFRFIEQLQKSAKIIDHDAFVLKTNDRFSLGVPDLIIVMYGAMYAIECKFTKRYSQNSERLILSHVFTGPQISILRQVSRAGGLSLGAIQIKRDTAFIINPFRIPASGNFTSKELERIAVQVHRKDGIWRITEWPSKL